MRPNDPVIKLRSVVCKRATDAALLVTIEGSDHWIPKSQVHDDSEVFDEDENSTGTLVISEWIAHQRGLI